MKIDGITDVVTSASETSASETSASEGETSASEGEFDYYGDVDAYISETESSATSSNTQNNYASGFSYLDSLFRVECVADFLNNSASHVGENVALKARVWNEIDKKFLLPSDVTGIVANLYSASRYSFSTENWNAVESWQNVAVPNVVFVDPQTDEEWTYDPNEFNFRWAPNQSVNTLFETSGTYYMQVKISLTNNRLPIVATFVISV